MMVHSFTVSAPSRLHFGMFSFGQAGTRQFGGVGAMVRPPAMELRLSADAAFHVIGPGAERIRAIAGTVAERLGCGELPGVRLEVHSAAPAHRGLGSGTQMALAVAAGLRAWLGLEPADAAELARLTGRGERSAVGAHGFIEGGLIVEAGKRSPRELGPRVARTPVPEAWRWLLIGRPEGGGLAGEAERRAFARLPPVPRTTTAELSRLALLRLLPAAAAADFEDFSDAVTQFGRLAGECFAAVQGGPYVDAGTAELVEAVRRQGVAGVGQSSWGPTVFALAPDEAAARDLRQRLSRTVGDGIEIQIAQPDNRGAILSPG